MSFSLFNESFYLAHHPDVQAAVNVNAGFFTYLSGTNFNEFGYIGLSTNTKVNPDVEEAVKAGYFASGINEVDV